MRVLKKVFKKCLFYTDLKGDTIKVLEKVQKDLDGDIFSLDLSQR